MKSVKVNRQFGKWISKLTKLSNVDIDFQLTLENRSEKRFEKIFSESFENSQ